MAVLGTLFGLPEMRTRLRIDLAQQGNLFLVLYVGIFIATLVAGPGIDVVGNKLILVGSATLVAAGMLGFAFAQFLCQFGNTGAAARMRGRRAKHLDQRVDLRFVPRPARSNVECLGHFLWNWRFMYSFVSGNHRGSCFGQVAVILLRGPRCWMRHVVFGFTFSTGGCSAEFLLARGPAGRAVSWRPGSGIFIVLPVGERSKHRRLDFNLRWRGRISGPDGHIHSGSVLGCADDGPVRRGAIAKVHEQRTIGARKRYRSVFRCRAFAGESFGSHVGLRSARSRIFLRRGVPDSACHRGR